MIMVLITIEGKKLYLPKCIKFSKNNYPPVISTNKISVTQSAFSPTYQNILFEQVPCYSNNLYFS